ncbi:unnamed protein product [Tuber aestivum]|uniref:Carrier domain-containing protein n=1 Tax=Tuber aestivum TaxID=59557 RepID=A0A292PIR8_9PEZI|nr:unnamed protein product [Tuber aestivum]
MYWMSGDWIPLDLPGRIRALNPASEVISLGGATEGSIWSVYFPIGEVDTFLESIPYGYPLGNQEMYVLDANLSPCPVNVPGDIYIGGIGVAQGYHNDPQKTAAGFMRHPGLGKQLYRTGDMGCQHPDGFMMFLGRQDGQVKINGFRVELGEIETVLKLSPLVKQGIVLTVEDDCRNKRLVAYVVVHEVFAKEELQKHLSAHLPAYMVPSVFVEIDRIPLSSNGKVDRKALPDPAMNVVAQIDFIAPGDAMEVELAAIWSKLLKTERVGIHDNFFDAGGNSLTMIQLTHKINTAFGKDIQLIHLMKSPTIAEIKVLINAYEDAQDAAVLTLREGLAEEAAFIIPGALGSTEGYFGLAGHLPGEGAVYGLQMKGIAGNEIPNTSIEAMAAYNLEQIKQTGVIGGITLLAHSYGGIVIYEMIKQAEGTGVEIEKVILLDCFADPLSSFYTVQEADKLGTYFRSLIKFSQPWLDEKAVNNLVGQLPAENYMTFICEIVHTLPAKTIGKMWEVFRAAISAVYSMDEQLNQTVNFIQADNSKLEGEDWGDAGAAAGWDNYFSDVQLIYSQANHFTMGSQYKGMGKAFFDTFKQETIRASDILGYDLEELCIKDPERQLGKTAFTQPALYVVNAFTYYASQPRIKPDYFIGHSLGEYNALLAAEAFSFETGLRLVQKRGALMAAASGGGMAAVLGHKVEAVQQMLDEGGYNDIDIANINTPTQIVIAGPQDAINRIVQEFEGRKIKIFPLFTPVIANVTAKAYQDNQIESSVQWTDTIRTLMGKGVKEYEETGSVILTKMVNEIKENCTPILEEKRVVVEREVMVEKEVIEEKVVAEEKGAVGENSHANGSSVRVNGRQIGKTCLSTRLGSQAFRKDYGLKYAYVAGAMYRGIASRQLVVKLAKAGMLGFLGTGGMSLAEMEQNIIQIQQELTHGEAYGVNFLHNLNDPAFEMKVAELFLRYGVTNIEASAYMQMMPALVYYRLKGLAKGADGAVICKHKIIAKVSRPEVAEVFMRPAPEKMVKRLLEDGLISVEQAELSSLVPMSYDICVEADSGGHTDRGIAMVLLPSIQRLRTDITAGYAYGQTIRIGLAGGIGTPQAATCAYVMGADFILTGSINQCTVEAGTSDAVKDLLQDINVQDTDYAPAGDMFEIGAKVQVLRKGVLFAARANKLYALYNQYNGLDDIPEKTLIQLEKTYFGKTIAEIWDEVRVYCKAIGAEAEIVKAEQNPKNKMALVFRWYFGYTNKLAFEGNIENKTNFQIHTGSALGAFNQWVKGTQQESWKKRHVDEIGISIMVGAAKLLEDAALMGSHYRGMGRALFEQHPKFKSSLEKMDEVVQQQLNRSLIDELYIKNEEPFEELLITHPAIVAVEIALYEVIIAMGIKPDFVW